MEEGKEWRMDKGWEKGGGQGHVRDKRKEERNDFPLSSWQEMH